MGLFDAWNERKRVKVAAQQMWDIVKRGINFEVPLIFDKNDLTLQAIAEMQRKHPEVEMRMYQSKGLVVGLFRGGGMKGNHGISEGVLEHFSRAGNIEGGFNKMNVEDLLARHEGWLRSQHLDPKEQERLAQTERMQKEAIVLTTKEGKTVVVEGSSALKKAVERSLNKAEKPVPGTENDVPFEKWVTGDYEKPSDAGTTATTESTTDGASKLE